MTTRRVETSKTSPLRVDQLPGSLPGKVGLTFAPGKQMPALLSSIEWRRDLGEDLDRLAQLYQTRLLVSLVEGFELATMHIEALVPEASRRGIEVLRFPIRDGDVPDDIDAVRSLVDQIVARAARGDNVVIHCAGGLGRTGTVAGCFLVNQGHRPAQAFEILARARGPRCPENPSQKAFVERFASLLDGAPAAAPDDLLDRVRGCVLGAAIGDAMGHPTEFMSADQIRRVYGPSGVQRFELYWGRGAERFAPYTDDTQLAEAVARSMLSSRAAGEDLEASMQRMARSFVAWSRAPQGGHRAPGNACLNGCHALAAGAPWREAGGAEAGGCGSVMRSYPFGILFRDDLTAARRWASEHSRLTHNHPIALAACAAMAVGVALCLRGNPVHEITAAMQRAAADHSDETASMIERASREGREQVPPDVVLARLQGWAAHEAIAAAAYLLERNADDLPRAILEGASSDGDSDSIATLAGALLGARHGLGALPASWVSEVERSSALLELADGLASATRTDQRR